MKIKQFLQLITLFFGVLIGTQALASDWSEAEATQWAKGKGEEILSILASSDIEEKYTKLDNILQNDIDLDYAARFVVGKYWKQMNEEQREMYLDLFKRYTSSLYKSYPLTIDEGDVSFTVDKVVIGTKHVDVHCTLFIKKLEQNVDNGSKGGFKVIFSLTKKDDKIKVRDLKVSESSFLVSYRDRFYKMIHEDNDDDIEWFLDDLEMHIEDAEKKNAQNNEDEEL